MTRWRIRALAVRLRKARWALVVVAALGTCVVVQSALQSTLDSSLSAAGTAIGKALVFSNAEAAVDWDALERDVAAAEPSVEEAIERQAPTPASDDKAKGRGATGEAKSKAGAKGAKGVYVSAAQVLRLSKIAKVPASRYVEPKGERPAGLQVAGVSGLGIGVRDGDVLTRVAGAEVKSSASVISTVLQLRAKRTPSISGEFWRGQERFQIVFQMPYLSSEPGPSGSLASSSTALEGSAVPVGSSAASN